MLVFDYHSASVNAVTFSRDGRLLASASDDGTVQLTDLSLTTDSHHRLAWGAKFIFSVDLSPDGMRLAAGTDSSLVLFRERHGEWLPVFQRKDHAGWVTTVTFDPTGELLATGGIDGHIRLWDANRRRRRPLRILLGPLGPIRSVRFSPDGQWVAAAGLRGLGLWHPLWPEPCFVRRLNDADARSLAFGHDGQSLWIATNRSVLLLDTSSGQVELFAEGSLNLFRSLQTSSVEGLLLIGRDDGQVERYQTDDLQLTLGSLTLHHEGAINAVAIHPCGEIAATAGDDNRVCLWSLVEEASVTTDATREAQWPGLPIHQFKM
jgi:WD40 repeat protein